MNGNRRSRQRRGFLVIVDCDDVIYKCNEEALRLLNHECGTTFRKSDIHNWGMNCSGVDARLKYFSDPEFVTNQPLYPGAKEFIACLLNKDVEVMFATNVPPQCAGVRVSAIVRDFPEIPISNILIGGRKDLLAADMMLDDAPQNLEGAYVRYPVLFRQPWNHHRSGLLSVSTYEEFLTLVDVVMKSESAPALKPGDLVGLPLVVVLVGPTGSGKKQLAEKLCSMDSKVQRVVSYSTLESPRYHTVTPRMFEDMRGTFFETSAYMGHLFGTRVEDVRAVLDSGRIPVLVMDINGALAMKTHFRTLTVFVTETKERCIQDILSRSMSIGEATDRIVAIDAELCNDEFCDISVPSGDEGVQAILQILGR